MPTDREIIGKPLHLLALFIISLYDAKTGKTINYNKVSNFLMEVSYGSRDSKENDNC